MNEVIIDGMAIRSEADFHKLISMLLDFGPYYGNNLDALYDRLYRDVERPFHIIWKDSEFSKKFMGERFDKIIDVFDTVKRNDRDTGCRDDFYYDLE